MSKICFTEKEYKTFRMLQLKNRQLISFIPCGSFFEIPAKYFVFNPTDIDFMFCPKEAFNSRPIQCHQTAKFKDEPLLTDTENCHVGFTRLRQLHNPQFFRKPLHDGYPVTRGPAWIDSAPTMLATMIFTCLNKRWQELPKIKVDRVCAVHCPIWPVVAKEWLTRKRENCWPSSQVINEIVELGCHLVAKPHLSDPNDDTQWRFSFSQAELILINTWTDVQMYTYHVLRLIKCEIVKACGGEDATVLCTYFFKTLMLWACEEKPGEFWEEENLETSIGELLCMMIEWLIERRCPNYFIRENNMIDYLSDEVDLSKEILLILIFRENSISALALKFSKVYTAKRLRYEIPKKVITSLVLAINNCVKPILLLSTVNIWSLDSDIFVPELRHLFEGIRIHQCLARLKSIKLSVRLNESVEAIKNFELAMSATDDSSVWATFSFSLSFGNNVSFLWNSVVGYGSENQMEDDDCIKFPVTSVFGPLTEIFTSSWLSPTFVVSAAYYANFLFSVLGDYRSAADQYKRCKKYLDVLKNVENGFDNKLFKDTFYVLLTNEWSELFDEHIQAVLGFLTLFSASRFNRGGSRKIVFSLSPMLFLKYINFQSKRRLGERETVSFDCDFNKVIKRLFFDIGYRNNVSRILLLTAICASGIRRKRTGVTTYSVKWPQR